MVCLAEIKLNDYLNRSSSYLIYIFGEQRLNQPYLYFALQNLGVPDAIVAASAKGNLSAFCLVSLMYEAHSKFCARPLSFGT